jgi:hypothetical protein
MEVSTQRQDRCVGAFGGHHHAHSSSSIVLVFSQDHERVPMLKWFISLLLIYSIVTISLHTPPVSKETWIISPDGRTASVTGRVRQPIWIKLNLIWWFLNDDESDPPDWQLPGKPFIIRQLSWSTLSGLRIKTTRSWVRHRSTRQSGRMLIPSREAGRSQRSVSVGCAFPLFPMRTIT